MKFGYIGLGNMGKGKASKDMFLDEYTLLKNAKEGQVFIDHATVTPSLSSLCMNL